jgi:hypothetical protein
MWVKGVRVTASISISSDRNGVESILYLGVKMEKCDMVE